MALKISETKDGVDEVSVATVNRKLESFVEITMKKLIDMQSEMKKLKQRITVLEKERV